MNLTVLNKLFQTVYILESYESLIWVDKYNEPGTFELYSPVTSDILEYFKPDFYFVNDESEHVMIIEDISIESDVENGNKIKVIGRSLESILDRRIIWPETTFKKNHNLQKAIRKLVKRNIGSDATELRKIINFVLADETTITSIASLKLTDGAQFNYSNNLLEVIQSLCKEYNIGFKITLDDFYLGTPAKQFTFRLYNGVDRSYAQSDRNYVVYSPEFDNVLSSNYKEENSLRKNVAYLSNEDEENFISRIVDMSNNVTGIARRETYVSASDITNQVKQEDDSRGDEEGAKTDIDPEELKKLMDQKGKRELAEIAKSIKTFDAECDTSRLYVYGKDYFIGDIVQLGNEYGFEKAVRVTEFTWSCTSSGVETYPTFVSVEEEVES